MTRGVIKKVLIHKWHHSYYILGFWIRIIKVCTRYHVSESAIKGLHRIYTYKRRDLEHETETCLIRTVKLPEFDPVYLDEVHLKLVIFWYSCAPYLTMTLLSSFVKGHEFMPTNKDNENKIRTLRISIVFAFHTLYYWYWHTITNQDLQCNKLVKSYWTIEKATYIHISLNEKVFYLCHQFK